MCIICVQVIRDRITMKEALAGFEEITNLLDMADDDTKHAVDVIRADKDGDVERVTELVRAGYRKERWL
jgi:hypothetical protein